MNSEANENDFSGQNAQKMPSGTVIGASAGAKTAAQEGKTPIRLDVSWDVASAQNVAIVDKAGDADDHALPPVASLGPVAPSAQARAA
jgi:hypothetical protein